MINLIPKDRKKLMVRGFYSRLATLFLFMLSLAVFVGSIALLPAYFISSVKKSASDFKLENQKNEKVPLSNEQALTEIKDINSKLSIVENAEKNKFLPSEKVVDEILSKKTSNIKITQILYNNDATQDKKINILGTASSRQALLSFEETLMNDPAFKNVNLPISSFVKDSDIQFNLSLISS